MSTPPFLDLPSGARSGPLHTTRGPFAALDVRPERAQQRGSALLVPGYTGSKEDFIAVLAPLRDHGWRVVAIDQRGQYESPHAPDPAAYDIAELAADLLAMIEAMGDGKVHLLGHSFGGLVARAAAIADPAAIATLVLLGSGPAELAGPPAIRLRTMLAALAGLDLPGIWTRMRQLDDVGGVAPPREDILAFLERRFCANDPRALRRLSEQLLVEPDRVDELRAALRTTGTPVLVTHGERDDAWDIGAQRNLAERLGARYAVVADSAHSPAAEAPTRTAALLNEFWAGARREPSAGSRGGPALVV